MRRLLVDVTVPILRERDNLGTDLKLVVEH